MIEMKQVTKQFKGQKGVFDINLSIPEGEVLGFLGPNGAGKSTTIRMLMGFMKPDSGSLQINGRDCFEAREIIQRSTGYISGELALINEMTGLSFLKTMLQLRGITNHSRMNELIDRFQLDARQPIQKMSKGMKQKVAIVNAMMHEPSVLILDEPTSGLDPLIQRIFLEEIEKEKAKGTTILMSSHSFTEVARTCDTICIIKDGRIVDHDTLQHVQTNARQIYTVTFERMEDARAVAAQLTGSVVKDRQLTYYHQGDVNKLLSLLNQYKLIHLNVYNESLEEIFMHFYEEGRV